MSSCRCAWSDCETAPNPLPPPAFRATQLHRVARLQPLCATHISNSRHRFSNHSVTWQNTRIHAPSLAGFEANRTIFRHRPRQLDDRCFHAWPASTAIQSRMPRAQRCRWFCTQDTNCRYRAAQPQAEHWHDCAMPSRPRVTSFRLRNDGATAFQEAAYNSGQRVAKMRTAHWLIDRQPLWQVSQKQPQTNRVQTPPRL